MPKPDEPELIIYGKQPVFEALRSTHKVRKLIIAREIEQRSINKILNLAENRQIDIKYEKKSHFQQICGAVLHQGVVASMDPFQYQSEERLLSHVNSTNNPLILIMDQIQDPHNFGAIIRTAEVTAVTAVIIPEKGGVKVSSTVAKTSAGAIFHCAVHCSVNLVLIMKSLQEIGITLFAMAPHQPESIYDTDFTLPLGIVIGSEGKGVRKNIQRLCDKSISIPGQGKTDSLNASVSTAVVLFEAVRQRRLDS
jgi:23S rRNA (guanosine2251-2'-O)-methyltransferase